MRLVTAAIIRKGDLVLVARRSPSQKLAGFWEFPGGKVEENESLEDCLVREIREELGVTATAGRTLCESDFHYEHGFFRIVAIEALVESTDFTLKDHDKIAWLPPQQLHSLSLLPADEPIVAVLEELLNDQV
jgi:8-oxo-dGTP diphosphatase